MPNNLLGDKALQIWLDVRSGKEFRARCGQSWAQQKKAFAMAMLREEDYFPELTARRWLAGALADDTVNLSPLYRYCVAVGENLPKHMKIFKSMALRQYVVAQDLYDEVWGGWIPEHLKDEADALCIALPREQGVSREEPT
jgi:hypothetical protein